VLILGGLGIWERIYYFEMWALSVYKSTLSDGESLFNVQCELVGNVSSLFDCCGLRDGLASFNNAKYAKLSECCYARSVGKVIAGCNKERNQLSIAYTWLFLYVGLSVVIFCADFISIENKYDFLSEPNFKG
jgi:hypothetical protein